MSGTTFCCLKSYRAFIRRETGICFSLFRISQGRRTALTCTSCMCSKMGYNQCSKTRPHLRGKDISSKYSSSKINIPEYQICLQGRKRRRNKLQLERDVNLRSKKNFYQRCSGSFFINGRQKPLSYQQTVPGFCLPELEETSELQELAGQQNLFEESSETIPRCPTCGQGIKTLGKEDYQMDKCELLQFPFEETQTETTLDTWGNGFWENSSDGDFEELFS